MGVSYICVLNKVKRWLYGLSEKIIIWCCDGRSRRSLRAAVEGVGERTKEHPERPPLDQIELRLKCKVGIHTPNLAF